MDQLILQILEKTDRNFAEVQELVEYFSELKFFKQFLGDVKEDVVNQIFKDVSMERYSPQQVVFFEGDYSNSKMYVIVKGSVVVLMKQNINVFETESTPRQRGPITQIIHDEIGYGDQKAQLFEGAYFGEKAILEKGGRRLATVIAKEPTHLLVISRSNYLQIKDNLDEEQRKIKDIMIQVIPEISKVSSPLILEQLAYTLTLVKHKKNETIIKEGDIGETIFILVEGTCEISRKIDFHIKQRKHNYQETSIHTQIKTIPEVKDTIPKKFKLIGSKSTKLNIGQELDHIDQTPQNKNQRKKEQNQTKKDQSENTPIIHIDFNKKPKQVGRSIQVKVSQTNPYDILGCEILFPNDAAIQTVFEALKIKVNDTDKPINQYQVQRTIRKLIDNRKEWKSPYAYRVRVISEKAVLLRLSKGDFMMRFPKESVETVQFNYLYKRFQRFMVTEAQDIKADLEDQDRRAWLDPEKEVISKRSESTYIKRLYTDFLLRGNLDSNIQTLPKLSMKSVSQDRIPGLRKYQLPNTFDFGKESQRQRELDIQNELSNRGLLKKKEKQHHRELYGDIKEALRQRVTKSKHEDVPDPIHYKVVKSQDFAYLVVPSRHTSVHSTQSISINFDTKPMENHYKLIDRLKSIHGGILKKF